jgi:ComF family protein
VVIPRTNYHLTKENPVVHLFWGRCLIQNAAAFSFYNKGSRIRRLIHNLKYKGIQEIGFELGRMYGLSMRDSEFCKEIDLIVPVPLHPLRLKRRGFNQSYLISKGLSDVTGIPVENESLLRISVTATQTTRSRYDRWTNVEGVFSISEPDKIIGKHILLVDDVITTGSTIESCADELLKIDRVKVSVVALAFSIM